MLADQGETGKEKREDDSVKHDARQDWQGSAGWINGKDPDQVDTGNQHRTEEFDHSHGESEQGNGEQQDACPEAD